MYRMPPSLLSLQSRRVLIPSLDRHVLYNQEHFRKTCFADSESGNNSAETRRKRCGNEMETSRQRDRRESCSSLANHIRVCRHVGLTRTMTLGTLD